MNVLKRLVKMVFYKCEHSFRYLGQNNSGQKLYECEKCGKGERF